MRRPGRPCRKRLAAGLLATLTMVPLAAAAQPAGPEIARAQEIVGGKCFICHGADGESSSPVFPRLAGQHGAYVVRQLADYKSGRRKSSTMRERR